MKSILLFAYCFSFHSLVLSQSLEKKLISLDEGWEKALLESDVTFLENLLSEDFLWVHNHAGQIDGKEAAISRAKRIQAGQNDDTRNRTTRDRQVIILGETGLVSGFTVVDRGPSPVTYHFMRTYAQVNGAWKLLGNHTMAIPDEELN